MALAKTNLKNLKQKAIAIIESFGGYEGGWYNYAVPTDAGLLYISLERLSDCWIPMIFRNEDIDNAREVLKQKNAIAQNANFYSGKWNIRVAGNDFDFLLDGLKTRLRIIATKK